MKHGEAISSRHSLLQSLDRPSHLRTSKKARSAIAIISVFVAVLNVLVHPQIQAHAQAQPEAPDLSYVDNSNVNSNAPMWRYWRLTTRPGLVRIPNSSDPHHLECDLRPSLNSPRNASTESSSINLPLGVWRVPGDLCMTNVGDEWQGAGYYPFQGANFTIPLSRSKPMGNGCNHDDDDDDDDDDDGDFTITIPSRTRLRNRNVRRRHLSDLRRLRRHNRRRQEAIAQATSNSTTLSNCISNANCSSSRNSAIAAKPVSPLSSSSSSTNSSNSNSSSSNPTSNSTVQLAQLLMGAWSMIVNAFSLK